MKKLRIIIRIATSALVLFTIVGITLLVINDHNAIDTSYEIIAFSLGAAGMIMAVISQIDSYQSDKQAQKVLKEIEQLNREHDADEKVDRNFQKKLDSIIQDDRRIYRRLGKSQPESVKKAKNE